MSRGRFVLAAAALLAAVLLVALGVWQVERRRWKLDLIAQVDARLAAAPITLPHARWAGIGRDDAYTRVRFAGRWIVAEPVLVKAVTQLGGGWWVMAPLATADGTILVNRGFVPERTRPAPATGRAVVTGLLRVSEPGGAFLRANDPAGNRWFSRDVAAIARARGWNNVAPFFVDSDAVPGPAWPRGGMTVVRFPNNHLVYALTWFALAIIAGWFAWRVLRERRA